VTVPVTQTLSNASGRKKPLRISTDTLVETGYLPGYDAWPLVIRPAVSGVELSAWAQAARATIDDNLRRHGAILFRGFGVATLDDFERFARATSSGGLLDYQYCSTPRRRLAGRVYTSTDYPSDQVIPFHNEMSYHSAWPMKIWFNCLRPAAAGGATPLSDSAAVFDLIDPRVRARFIEHGVMYVRNYGLGLDLSCERVFGTSNRQEIEAACDRAGIEYEWHDSSALTTRQRCQAVAVHPRTGRHVWFNQAHLFHVSSLGADVARELVAELGEHRLPRHAYYGDGTAIEPDALDRIRAAYRQAQVIFPWEPGDVLMLDNMLIAHGRESYSGERIVAVAMAEEHGSDASEPERQRPC